MMKITKQTEIKSFYTAGLKCFPIPEGTKKADLKGWPSYDNEKEVTEHVGQGGNYGVIIGVKHLVIDVDMHGNVDGKASLAKLRQHIPELGNDPDANTPNNGFHYIFELPSEFTGKFKKSLPEYPGIDILTGNKYIVGIGSQTDKGTYLRKYVGAIRVLTTMSCKVLEGSNSVENIPPSQARYDVSEKNQERVKEVLKELGIAVEGQGGDNRTLQAANICLDHGLDPETALMILLEWNDHCDPPWEICDLESKIRSALSSRQNPIGCRLVEFEQQKTIQLLADMPPFQYAKIKKAEAEKLGVGVRDLDTEVKRLRVKEEPETGGQKITFPEEEPWPNPVDGAQLVKDLVSTFNKYSVLPAGSAEALALWTILSYCYDIFHLLPMVALTSPEKRCGKTTTLETLSCLCRRPLPSSGISTAAVYRVIEAVKPCLLIDELDTVIAENEELRGVLNSGHTKKTAVIIRCAGDDNEPRSFSTWCPKIVAMIGRLPGTIQDRSILVPMERKPTGRRVDRHEVNGEDLPEFVDLRSRILRFVEDKTEELKLANPEKLDTNNDRAADNWKPLLIIAAVADCEPMGRDAARTIQLCATGNDDISTMLLQDLSEVLEMVSVNMIGSFDLVKRLCALEARPWGENSRGKMLTQTKLANLLRPYKVHTQNMRDENNKIIKGYEMEKLREILSRYKEAS